MENNDLNGHHGRTVVGERIPHERPVLTVGREDESVEVNVIVTKDEPTPSFVYEAPGTSSLTKTLCLRPMGDNGDGGELVEVELRLHDPNGFGEGHPYLRAEGIRVPRKWLEVSLLSMGGGEATPSRAIGLSKESNRFGVCQ